MNQLFQHESLTCPGATIELAIYNKKKEMEYKNEGTTNIELMRVEYRFKKASSILNNLGTQQFLAMRDLDVSRCFEKRTAKIFRRVDKYLSEKMRYQPGENGMRNTITNMLLETNQPNVSCLDTLFAKISFFESYYGVPCLLDLNDLCTSWQSPFYQQYVNAINQMDFYQAIHERYVSVDHDRRLLIGQRERYEELRRKLLSNDYRSLVELNC